MEQTERANAKDLMAALSPTRRYWKQILAMHQDLDQTVKSVVGTPMFQLTYQRLLRGSEADMLIDVRSGASLIASYMFTINELATFSKMGLDTQLFNGMALAARHMRSRAMKQTGDALVTSMRLVAFTFVLKLIGEDMRDPREYLEKLIDQFDLADDAKVSLLTASLANVLSTSSQIVLH